MTAPGATDILPRMSRLFHFAFTMLAMLFALAAIALGILAWKLVARPLASSELTPYVEAVVERLAPGTKASIGHSNIAWDNNKHIITITCDQAQLFDQAGKPVVSFPNVSVKVGLWSLLRGRVVPIELMADNAQFWFTHHRDGSWTGGGSSVQAVAPSSDDGTDVLSFLKDVGDELANETLSHHLSINEAVYAVHDEMIQKDWALTAREITLTHEKTDTSGNAKIEVTQGDRTAFMTAHYHYDRPARQHQTEVTFQDIRLSALATQDPNLAFLAALDLPLTGTFSFGTDRALNVSAAALTIEGGAGQVISDALWDKPREVRSLSIEAHYTQANATIDLSKFMLDLGGPVLSLTAQTKTPPTRDLIWRHPRQDEAFEAKVKLTNLPMDQFADVWPKLAVPNARSWLIDNLKQGRFTQGEMTLRGRVKWDDLASSELNDGEGKIAADSARVTYMPGMPAIENVSAEATFDLRHMDVKILGGHTGDIKILPFTLSMTDFDKVDQYISIPVRLTGPTQSVLKLLDSPPLGYAKAVGLVPSDTSGQVEGVLTLAMPMLNDLLLDDIKYKAEATFKDLGLKNMIPKIEVSQGNLAFHLSQEGFALEGPVALNAVPMSLIWKSHFNSQAQPNMPLHEATVTGAIKGDQWAAFGLEGMLKTDGLTPIKVQYANVRKGLSRLSGELDFKNSSVQVETIGWDKPRGVAAKLNIDAEMADKKDIKIKTFVLRGTDINVKGTAELDGLTGDVRKAQLNPYILGKSDASIQIVNPQEQSDPVQMLIEGKALDMSGLDSGSSKDQRPRAKIYDITLEKLYTSDKGFLTNVLAKMTRDQIGWSAIDFTGLAQGETPVRVSLRPEGLRKKFEVTSDNFGTALTGMGLSDTVKGGTIWIGGESLPEDPRVISGKVKIDSFSVSGLPVLARLLSAVSPFGFLDLITGDAAFDRLRGGFKWSGSHIELNKVRAVGSVAGINLDGHVDTDTNTAMLSGTLVPFSFMNSVIGSIPLLGDVITGGDGQGVIAASFTVRGSLDDPAVSVNPVSLLTPGFLRNLFFPGDDGEEVEKVK